MLSYSIYTDKGDMEVNEDSAGVFENAGMQCFVLCDGLGGHGMGDTASSLAVKTFGDRFAEADSADGFLDNAFMQVQDTIISEQKRLGAQNKMKTTAVVLVNDSRKIYFGHVGDSRLYCFKHDKVYCRTLDHSVPQMLVTSREIDESQIRHHPDRNRLLRVIGTEWDTPKYELSKPMPMKKFNAFLLCSDGFWELIDEKAMCELLKKSSSAEQWLELMCAETQKNRANGNSDNLTAIAVFNS